MSKRQRPRIGRIVVAAAAGIILLGLGAFSWQWLSELRVEEVTVSGNRYASTPELLALVEVDSTTAMLDVVPDSVAMQVMQHPWVKEADVSRRPTGRLSIRVAERVPVALALNSSGAPWRYLDADGRTMPLLPAAVYDVPTIDGVTEAVVEDRRPELLGFVAALERLPREVKALIGHAEYRSGDVWIHTLPAGAGNAVPVRLGTRDFEQRLIRLYTFWHRAIAPQPAKQFELVDLRFDSQVVTRESVQQP